MVSGRIVQLLKPALAHARHKIGIELAIVEYGLFLRTDVAQIVAIEFDATMCSQPSHGKGGFEHNTKRSRRWIRAIFAGVLVVWLAVYVTVSCLSSLMTASVFIPM